MNKLQELTKLGQSIWLDYIRRSFIASGELKSLIDEGVRGVTSNPTIFEKAIAGSSDYDEQLAKMAGSTLDEMYEALVLEDIRRAAELLRPVWDSSAGADGYVSLEVSPELARDTKGTIAEARRLFKTLDKPNVMIKVPATKEGIPAIEALIAEGINVNATLIFSLQHYEAAAEAYLAGLEKLVRSGGDLGRVASVASFFVSRVDAAVDKALEELGEAELKGKIAIANSKASFLRSRKLYSGERWRKLAAGGARVQRLLWASTGTKNPSYPDTLYLDTLIGPDTVNTVPPATLDAFRDHGTVSSSLEMELEKAVERLERLNRLGVDLEAITEKLQEDGVTAFAKSFRSLRQAIVEKAKILGGGEGGGPKMLQVSLGAYQQAVDAALEEMAAERVMQRIWSHDHTVWKTEPTEIDNRLGWLTVAETSKKNIGRLTELADELRTSGYRQAVLLGRGGSSLAPEVFSKTFGPAEGYLKLSVIDSTDPDLILSYAEELDLNKTLFIVSTKSGGTVETLSFFKYFYNRTAETVGADKVGEHFVAITDPGSKLADLAARYSFRRTFLNDPNIGGRYSALSYFGLLPAALLGIDLKLLLRQALAAAHGSAAAEAAGIGTIMGQLALETREGLSRDKVTIFLSPQLASFGDWVEQL
ncbi:MAG: bifunctional transaldolase/phosoglucose isomerase, partial [Spirochaetales bacterium]|nr:bifunctional transaldolase/phosoglucose isomerase [Spirochaetales bacterium]